LAASLVGAPPSEPIVGYNDAGHLAPAVACAALYFTGLALTRTAMMGSSRAANDFREMILAVDIRSSSLD
jgi:hypothetical protein